MGYSDGRLGQSNKSKSEVGLYFAIVVFIAIIIIGYSRGAFIGEDVAIRTLEAQGYKGIEITDHTWFLTGFRGGCDGRDAARFTAKATNPAGVEVTVYVCTDIFKGGTIRVP